MKTSQCEVQRDDDKDLGNINTIKKKAYTIKYKYKIKKRLQTSQQYNHTCEHDPQKQENQKYLSYLAEGRNDQKNVQFSKGTEVVKKEGKILVNNFLKLEMNVIESKQKKKKKNNLNKVDLSEVWQKWMRRQTQNYSLFQNNYLAGAIPNNRRNYSHGVASRKNGTVLTNNNLNISKQIRKGDISALLQMQKLKKLKITSIPLKQEHRVSSPDKRRSKSYQQKINRYSSIGPL